MIGSNVRNTKLASSIFVSIVVLWNIRDKIGMMLVRGIVMIKMLNDPARFLQVIETQHSLWALDAYETLIFFGNGMMFSFHEIDQVGTKKSFGGNNN